MSKKLSELWEKYFESTYEIRMCDSFELTWITDDFSIAPRGVDFFSGSNEDLNSPQKTEKHANSKSWTVCEKPIRVL